MPFVDEAFLDIPQYLGAGLGGKLTAGSIKKRMKSPAAAHE